MKVQRLQLTKVQEERARKIALENFKKLVPWVDPVTEKRKRMKSNG